MSITHNFSRSLLKSGWEEHLDAMNLDAFFGDYHCVPFPEGSNDFQKAGFDAVVFYDVDKTATIDFKLDSYDSERLAIEVVSNNNSGKAGWATDKTKRNDFFVYHFTKTKETFILPRLQLQRWLQTYDSLIADYCSGNKEGFKLIRASNRTYETICYGIPKEVIKSSFGKICQIGYTNITIGDKKK